MRSLDHWVECDLVAIYGQLHGSKSCDVGSVGTIHISRHGCVFDIVHIGGGRIRPVTRARYRGSLLNTNAKPVTATKAPLKLEEPLNS
jgi:hypothetical protein